MTKPIPKVYTIRFFQLVSSRQFAEAERILERVKQKMHVTERNRGYFQALYGMLLTQKNNDDRYGFLSGTDLTDKKLLKHYRHEFLSHVNNRLHAEYDRGFFEAWADYMKILPKLESSSLPVNNKNIAETEREAERETIIEAKAEEETRDHPVSEGKEKAELQEESAKQGNEEKLVKPSQSTLFDFAR